MSEENVNLTVARDSLTAVVLCLALGTLEAMKSGVWPLEAGIWTMGRPSFWKPLSQVGLPEEVIGVLQSADELDAIQEMNGRETAEVTLDQMICILRKYLEALPNKSWCAGLSGFDMA